jgi:putative NIF3 family GTP cyclohydrolase 1 type 2
MVTKRLAGIGAIALFGFLAVYGSQDTLSKKLTARDVETYLRSLGPWVDEAKTCDSFKAGDPDREVKAVAVSWMSTCGALREAQARRCDLFITHEPTFYSHYDNDPSFDADRSTIEKRKFLKETGMVVYRCHDVWDRVPEIGILDSWAKTLGFEGKPVAAKTYYAVYSLPESTVDEFARKIAKRLKTYGQEAVQVVGDGKAKIRKIAIGTGAITDAKEMYNLGADAAVITEVRYWRDVRWAQDIGFPLFIVEHSVSEYPGLENLARHLRVKFPGVRVEYIQEGCPFHLVF